ncbi:transcriptional regulator, IclR family [Kribbella flavida DSM 17836]|uniref:Glycerol operon regulatory protein n=1 Tax=Kribbella flavida (strain DSM 17836 / JCM 10339 / NBRC 14399) TaxID=479435 RepID=D2Q243_KRIFD|nr:IclR family transcriptional regulator [Kribbella flavida]ADB33989.1 transcriptional regulator, IclR family [Kribbella flavida DSM 17836]
MTTEEVRLVKSAERTLRILEVLGEARGPISVTELHKRTGYPRSSLHQLLHTMIATGWIESTSEGALVGIGSRALLVGTAYLDRDPALPFGIRTLEKIREETGYTSHYARLDGGSVIYLATRESLSPHRATSRVGRQLPAYATSLGKALLAELTLTEVSLAVPADPLPGLTPHTVPNQVELAIELEQTRQRGYSLEREQNTLGLGCIGVPVPYRIPATDAISCSIPIDQCTDAEVERVAAIIREQVQLLATKLRAEGIR